MTGNDARVDLRTLRRAWRAAWADGMRDLPNVTDQPDAVQRALLAAGYLPATVVEEARRRAAARDDRARRQAAVRAAKAANAARRERSERRRAVHPHAVVLTRAGHGYAS